MTIIQCLELSTCHITKETANSWPNRDDYPLIAQYEYGMFVHVPEPDPDEFTDLPEDLKAIIQHARLRGCTLIRFDADACPIEGLPTYEW